VSREHGADARDAAESVTSYGEPTARPIVASAGQMNVTSRV
jgi:hypothetical protein